MTSYGLYDIPERSEDLALGDIIRGGFELLRARFGLYAGMNVLIFGPIHVISNILQFSQLTETFQTLGSGYGAGRFFSGSGANTLFSLGTSFVLLIATAVTQSVVAASGLAQLRGEKPSFLDALSRVGAAPLWLMLFDVVLFVAAYLGLICCLVPGISLMILVAAQLPYLNAILVDHREDLVTSASLSSNLSRGDRATFVALGVLFFGLCVVAALPMIGVVGFMTFGLMEAGRNATAARAETIVMISSVVTVITYLVSGFLWMWYHLCRIYAYGRRMALTHAGARDQLAEVFR